jgi:hypothetical protein
MNNLKWHEPFQPKTHAGELVKTARDECKTFTDFWFGRDAKKTNKKLSELSVDIFLVYTCIAQLEEELKCRGDIVDYLTKYDSKNLVRILRIGGNEQDKIGLKQSRDLLISKLVRIVGYYIGNSGKKEGGGLRPNFLVVFFGLEVPFSNTR